MWQKQSTFWVYFSTEIMADIQQYREGFDIIKGKEQDILVEITCKKYTHS